MNPAHQSIVRDFAFPVSKSPAVRLNYARIAVKIGLQRVKLDLGYYQGMLRQAERANPVDVSTVNFYTGQVLLSMAALPVKAQSVGSGAPAAQRPADPAGGLYVLVTRKVSPTDETERADCCAKTTLNAVSGPCKVSATADASRRYRSA